VFPAIAAGHHRGQQTAQVRIAVIVADVKEQPIVAPIEIEVLSPDGALSGYRLLDERWSLDGARPPD
jgi:hypothetical protein